MTSRRMAREWQSTANENIENDTEELELKLWNEMSSILQEVYRNHRNTASSIRVSKQVSQSDNRILISCLPILTGLRTQTTMSFLQKCKSKKIDRVKKLFWSLLSR